jgi:hypothetical protein
MSIVPTIVLAQTTHGAANGAYSGINPPATNWDGTYNGTDLNWYSREFPGDGYYGYTDGLHTVSYDLTGFIGTIGFQASLATKPTNADWFDLTDSQIGNNINPLTIVTFKNFSGNFVWVRATITNFTAGTINKVLYIL